MCWRLQLDVEELKQHMGGLFGNGEMTGSIGVVTINLPEVGYLSKGDKVKFFSTLSEWMKISAQSLLLKKEEVIRNFERGLFPYTTRYLKTKFRTHFLTIGYIGMHEALLNFGITDGILSKEGKDFAIQILDFMRDKIVDFQKKHNTLFNLEAVPAEGASYRMAYQAKKRIPDLITSGINEAVFFTNSCHLPADKQGDLVFMLKHQQDLQCRHTGGTVVHFYIDGQPEEQSVLNMIKKVCSTKIPYFTLTTVFSICPVHGYISGKHDLCPYPHTAEQLEKYGIDVTSFA
jgi:ribonucleoside-triphosphate reductase